MRRFGLIGHPLTHSFSKKYFADKFENLGIAASHRYELYDIENAKDFPSLFESVKGLEGLNVTIPHKLAVMPYLVELDRSAEKVGAVNVIKKTPQGLKGYNSDYYGFQKSLLDFLDGKKIEKAMVLGLGGAAKAILAVFNDLGVKSTVVSRRTGDGKVSYSDASKIIADHHLIINCTPLGTYPNVDACPAIDYSQLSSNHFLFDLVYNPTETLFLKNGAQQGAKTKNGYDMLVNQAEKSWKIWNS